MDNETRALLRRVEQLEREVIALRKRVGNMPVRFGGGGGGMSGSSEIIYYGQNLPDAQTFLSEYGDGVLPHTAPMAYVHAATAYYRVVHGAMLTETQAGSGYRWASVTLPVKPKQISTNGIIIGETFVERAQASDKSPVLWYSYGRTEMPYMGTSGAISNATLV